MLIKLTCIDYFWNVESKNRIGPKKKSITINRFFHGSLQLLSRSRFRGTQSNTRYGKVTILDMLAVDVECCFRCVCLVVCVNLSSKTAVSRGEQNRYGWRRRTLLTARLIKSTAAYGLWSLRRLMAAARGSKAAGALSTEGLIYGQIWKQSCYNVFITRLFRLQ